ncbi:hypothetical protein P154DRAFT_528985 [Amniculicola lignicola CBS 123094]|uniref:Uncharacterized protein n=1 Tax=Amniculicola lignicola CBS 123094 TaxID=1392246 RepID=A0A6A5X349_9PLEO|nr:hypothetical protein P154DRAFT_528985 [Amniculicola lignicola CBS 123094]
MAREWRYSSELVSTIEVREWKHDDVGIDAFRVARYDTTPACLGCYPSACLDSGLANCTNDFWTVRGNLVRCILDLPPNRSEEGIIAATEIRATAASNKAASLEESLQWCELPPDSNPGQPGSLQRSPGIVAVRSQFWLHAILEVVLAPCDRSLRTSHLPLICGHVGPRFLFLCAIQTELGGVCPGAGGLCASSDLNVWSGIMKSY